jgi:hypothetical protein
VKLRRAKPFDYVAAASMAIGCMVLLSIIAFGAPPAPEQTIHWLNVATGQLQRNFPGELGQPLPDATAALGPVSNVCTTAKFHTHDARMYYCVKVGSVGYVFNGPPPLVPCDRALYHSGDTARNGYGCSRDHTGLAGWYGHWRPLR